MTAEMEGVMALDQLKDHYKHCIRLSASNKINQKNAFDLKLIDYMQDLVNITDDRQMNFKIASSALDVGAKIYSNRVDNIQSEAQKVASSILMALDGQQGKVNENPDDTQLNDSATSDRIDDEQVGDEQRKAKKKRSNRGKNVKTVVEDKNLLDAKLEKMVLGDPFLDGLSKEYDMSCPAALISYNALTQPEGLLTIESSHLRINFKDNLTSKPLNASALVTLISKNFNCAKIIRDNQNNQICPKLETFLFNDRTTKITGNTSAQEFRPEEYGEEFGNDANDCDDHFECNDSVMDPQEYNQPLDLDKIAASKPTDYFYPNHRLMNTWAGPHAWKAVKEPQTAKNPRKRLKLEQKVPEDYKIDFDENLVIIADKEIRHSSVVLRRWKKVFIPQDHSWDEEKAYVKIKHTLLKPEEVYECTKITPAMTENDSTVEPMNNEGGGFGSPGFDDVHDSDDEFRADPGVEGGDLNNTLTFQADMEFAGEHLIEQPYTVAQVNIPFAKMAKKMDVRKLKRVMWDLLAPPESNNVTNVTVIMNGVNQPVDGHTNGIEQEVSSKRIPTPCETPVHLEFSNLYGELPVRVNTKMASDLSQPIAFVTLLHLANEKNLKLIPKEDLKDFVIEQD